MRVAIFETSHFEGAYPVIKLFNNGSNEITIFTYRESFEQFQFLFKEQWNQYNWIVREEQESKRHFISRIYREVKARKIELLYLNTISDNFIFYAWMVERLKNVRVIVTIHSINNFFWRLPKFTFRAVVRSIGKKRLIKAVNEFNVVAITLVDYLRTKLPHEKKIHTVPGAIYEGRTAKASKSSLTDGFHLVVPGIVDCRRRDYPLVLEVTKALIKAGVKIQVTLLGGVNPEFGPPILKEIKKCNFNHILKYYESQVVDQPEFDRVMDEADLVFLPSLIRTEILDLIPEEYGRTQSTGTLFDIVKHAKPFLAPRNLKIDSFLEQSCLRYETVDEIVEVLVALKESPEVWKSIQEKAISASLNYTVDAVRKRNADLFGNT